MSLDVLQMRFEPIVPPGLVVEVGSGDELAALLPEEMAATEGWAPHRRAQFALGRAVARRAIERVGTTATAILFDQHGAPVWPAGAVASISHKRQDCIVAAGATSKLAGIGVDLEFDAVEPDADEDELISRTCPSPEERSQVAHLQPSCCSPGTVVLAAKEAFFKLQFPLTRLWLDWDDVVVTFGPSMTFAVSARQFDGASRVKGIVQLAGGWLVALAFLPQELGVPTLSGSHDDRV